MSNKKFFSILLLLFPLSLFAISEKRGVCENDFTTKNQLEKLAPGVCWYYNWGNTEVNNVEGQDFLEFVPMCWNSSYNEKVIKDYCKKHPEVKYLLGFNEPNHKTQANMTPKQAAAKWPEIQKLAKELNLKLVAPALNYSPDAPYYDPATWMDEFVGLVGKDAFDYVALHSYGGLGLISYLIPSFYEKYGKPVWLTEFCFWPDNLGNGVITPEEQIASMMESVEWLEKSDCVARYAWFKARGESSANSGPNFALLTKPKITTAGELTEQGKVYTYMSDFNVDHFHQVNTFIPASEYISQKGILLGSTKDPEALLPIEITGFYSGSTVDYQFDIPLEGDYELIIRFAGEESTGAHISVVLLNQNGTEKEILCHDTSIILPSDDMSYSTQKFPVNLKSGRQTLRLKNSKTSQTLRISSISLNSGAGVISTEIDEKNRKVKVYNLQGICLKEDVTYSDALVDLPAGVYVIDNKKVINVK